MLSKLIVILFMLLIVYNLGSGLYYLLNDSGDSKGLVKALSWRIGLSLLLFCLLFVGFYFGLIVPHGIGR